jgi:hypothetical protein
MPYKDPEAARQNSRERYERKKVDFWKHPDGSWKKPSNYGTEEYRAIRRKNYEKTKERVKVLAKERRRKEKEGWGNTCPLCQTTGIELVHDHCHESGVTRGYLCSACNLALGHARDNTETLARMIEYLTKWSPKK